MSRNTGPAQVSATVSLPLGTIGFITWLVFLILKVTGSWDISWFWVWFPFWLPWALFGVELVFIFIIALILVALDK